MSQFCIICDKVDGHLATVTERGQKTLEYHGKKKDDTQIYEALVQARKSSTQVHVHSACRKAFTDKRKLGKEKIDRTTRNNCESFVFKSNCIFCNEVCVLDKKHPSRKNWHKVTALNMKEGILEDCQKRFECDPTDEWGLQVKSRVLECIDLVAAQARYHIS